MIDLELKKPKRTDWSRSFGSFWNEHSFRVSTKVNSEVNKKVLFNRGFRDALDLHIRRLKKWQSIK